MNAWLAALPVVVVGLYLAVAWITGRVTGMTRYHRHCVAALLVCGPYLALALGFYLHWWWSAVIVYVGTAGLGIWAARRFEWADKRRGDL